ncbi:golgin subfamily A member 4-like isoform X2 [Montipora foliosa]
MASVGDVSATQPVKQVPGEHEEKYSSASNENTESDVNGAPREQVENNCGILQENQHGVEGLNKELSLETRNDRLKELTSEMANTGRRLQSQLTSLHETVCSETESSKELSKKWDPFPPELIARLHDSTSDVNCEVKVLERYLDQVRELVSIGGRKSNGFHEFHYEENNNQPDDQKLSMKAKIQLDEKKKCTKEAELLKTHLQGNGAILDHEGLIRRLEIDRSKLELDNLNFRRQLKLIKEKLSEQGQMDDELVSLTNIECNHGTSEEDGFALSELVTLRKERKVLLSTVQRLQGQGVKGGRKDDVDTKSDMVTTDAAVQCKMNVWGQITNQGVTFSNELEDLKRNLDELQAEYDELEEESKSMAEENSKMVEEKRTLEDSVNKLRSQVTDALDSILEEMEHLHREKEELQTKLQRFEEDNKKIQDSFVELSKKSEAHLKSVLDEIERKDSLEDAVDYLSTAVQKLNEMNNQALYTTTSEACIPGDTADKIHNSSLLSEIKKCKELIDSQREQIRQLQVDKRDIEDTCVNLKREVVVLKTKRGERRSVKYQSDSDSDEMQSTRKSSAERCEFLKQDILRLTKRGTELENVIKTLKSDNSNLEEEKVCLLDSLYHQLEKNEKLEVQIEKLKSIITEHNTGLDPKTTTIPLHNGIQRDSNGERDVNGNVVDDNLSDYWNKKGNDSSVDKLQTKSVQQNETLKSFEERFNEIENEKDKIRRDLDESRRNEKELQELVSTMKNEAMVNSNQLQKNQEVTNTLQGCLREAHEEKEELADSLDEVTEEKTALEKKIQILENELSELKEKYENTKGELESALDGVDRVGVHNDQMGLIQAKLSELYESLTDKDKDSSCEDFDMTMQHSTSLDEQGSRIIILIEKVQREVNLLRKELEKGKVDQDDLKAKLDSSETEKLSLQKNVRELDEKRRQVKSFITKLTEEKEAMSEQIDEIKQQKNNLADALENVYQSKEGLQCQLEDALNKQHESSKSLFEVAAEVQSLKKSLSRMVEERDALKEVLLERTSELQTLKQSEAKWKEKVTGAQAEADQSVEDKTEASKEDDEDVIVRLHLENDGLKKQLKELRSSHGFLKEEIPNENEAPIAPPEDLEIGDRLNTSEGEEVTVREDESSPLVYEMVTSFDKEAFEESVIDQTYLLAPVEISSTVESLPPDDLREERDDVFAQTKALEDEIEHLKSLLDSVSAEKQALEKENEVMAKEKKEMLRDLEKAREGQTETKLHLEETSTSAKSDEVAVPDLHAALEDKEKENAELQEDIRRNEEETEALQISNIPNDTLEGNDTQSEDIGNEVESSCETVREKTDALYKNNSTLEEEKEGLREQCKNLKEKNAELEIEKERIVWESDMRTKEVARLLEQVELFDRQLQEKSRILSGLEDKLKDIEKEKEDLKTLVATIKSEKEALEESLAKAKEGREKDSESIEHLRQELENTAKLNDEIEILKSTLKEVQYKLGNADDDSDLVAEQGENLAERIDEFKEKEKLLVVEIAAMSQENSNLHESLEALQGDKEFLARKLEETKMESNSMRDQLLDLKNQASDLQTFIDDKVKNNMEEQTREVSQRETTLLENVCECIAALSEEKSSLEARLEKAEASNLEIHHSYKQLLQERTELTIQLQEALDKEHIEEPTSQSKRGYDEVRLSREISDVRSLIEKLSLQKEKLGAALAHKEHQIATVTAEAMEKSKMLKNKEKEAESLTLTKEEVAVALEKAKNGSEKLLEELQREKNKVARLMQELESLKEHENADLHEVCVNRLEEEKKAFMMAMNKSRELEKRLKKIEEENTKILEQKDELEANVEAQAASIVSFETIGVESELKWKKEMEEKDEELSCLKQEMKKSNIAMTDLLRVVDELNRKIAELEKHCIEAEKSRKEAAEEINKLQARLFEETERKKELQAKFAEIEETIAKHEEENNSLKKQVVDNDKENQALLKSVVELEAKNKDKAKMLLDMNCTKTFLEDECKKTNSEITHLKEQLGKKTSSLENIEKELTDSREFIHEGKSKHFQLKKEREDLRKSLEATESKLRELEARSKTTKEQNEKLTEKLKASEKELTILKTACGEAQKNEQTLRDTMKAETELAETELESLNDECEILQKKLREVNEKNVELEKALEKRFTLEMDLAKLTDEHKALKIFSQKLVDEKVDRDEARREKREIEKLLRREKNERANIEEEMERLRGQYEALKSSARKVDDVGDQTDGSCIYQSEGEHIIACTEGSVLSAGVEIQFGLQSAPDDESSMEENLSKEQEKIARLREEIEELKDEKDELNEIIDEFRSKTKKLQTSVDALIEEKEGLEDKLDEDAKCHKEEIGSHVDKNKELSRKVEVLIKDKNLLHEEIKAREKRYSEKLEESKKLEDALEKSKQEAERLRNATNVEIAIRLESELARSKQRVEELESELEQVNLQKQEMTAAKENVELKMGAVQNDLYDELDHAQKELDKNKVEIGCLQDEVSKYRRSLSERKKEDGALKNDTKELEQLRKELEEKAQSIASLEDEFAAHKRLTYEREQEIHIHLDRIQTKLKDKDKKISTLEKELAEYKRKEQPDIGGSSVEITDNEYKEKLASLKNELSEKVRRIGSLEQAIVEYKRTRFEQERDIQAKEAHLAAAREELFKTMKETCEEEERMASVRHANNKLQEALALAKENENKLRKQLQAAQGRDRSQGMIIEDRRRSVTAENGLDCTTENVILKSSKLTELNLAPSEVEPNQLEKRMKSSSLENAKRDIATLEAQGQELRSELRKARDQVFDLQLELSDALRALRQKDRLRDQDRKLFQSSIEDMEKEYNKMRKEFSSLIAMEKNRSSFITVVELKGSLKKAESDMLEAISNTSDLLSKAKNDIKESRRLESEKEIAERSSERSRGFIEKSTQENKDLLRQLDDAWKERDRLTKKLKRSEVTQVLLKQILNESSVEIERFKRLVDECGKSEKRRRTSTGSQKPVVSTRELETQSDLTSTDLEEAEKLKGRLEELRKNIRGLEACLEEERSKGEGHLLDYLREKNRLNAEISALKECAQETTRKNETLQSMVTEFQEKLEHAQREKATAKIEVSGVRCEVNKLRKLSYDERAEKNSLMQANAELKRSLLETKEKDGKVVKESERVKELKKDKERLTAENEMFRNSLKDHKDNFVSVCKELENAKQRISELSNAKETVIKTTLAIETELRVAREKCLTLEQDRDELKSQVRHIEENCKELDNERAQLIADAHSFKTKMEKKNQDLQSKCEGKEKEALSLQKKVEGLSALQRKLENDCRSIEKERDRALSQVRTLESDKQRIEAINREQKAENERLRLDKGSHREMNEKLKNLFAEKDKLEALNKDLKMDMRGLYGALDAKSEEMNKVVQELHDMASKVKQLEKEKQRETSLKEELAEKVIEKDSTMKMKNKLLSDRLEGVIREAENLKGSSARMEQLGVECRRLEEENLQMIEATQKLQEEIISLKKENDLLKRACQQLRAGKKSNAEEKIVPDVSRSQVDREPSPRNKPLHVKVEQVVERVNVEKSSQLKATLENRRHKSNETVPNEIKISKGLQAPMPPFSGEGRGRKPERGHPKNQRSHSSPAVKRYPSAPNVKYATGPGSKGPTPNNSSRSSETDKTTCPRSSYCSPILSLVDTCPLHRNPSVERPPPPPVPNQCPICKKEKRRPGMPIQKEYVTSGKYV